MSALHFVRPEWLLALPVLALWVAVYWWQRRGDGGWRRFVDDHLLTAMLSGRNAKVWLPCTMLGVLALTTVLALAGPTWVRSEVDVNRDGRVRVFVVDMSRSMNATDLRPSRMVQARLKLLDLLDASEDRTVALIGFAAYPYTITPLTDDVRTLRLIAPLIETNMTPAQGADIDAALRRAADLVDQAFAGRGEVVLLSDSAPSEAAFETAARLAKGGLRTSVLAIGSGTPAAVPHGQGTLQTAAGGDVLAEPALAQLQRLASAGKGNFVALNSGAVAVESVLIADNRLAATAEGSDGKATLWRDDGAWLLWLGLLPVWVLARRGVLC